MVLSTDCLRIWQKKALPKYLDRFKSQWSELTVACQGSGKTVYTALCFVGSILELDITELSLGEIASKYKASPAKNKHFPIVFISRCANLDSMIETWKVLGVNLTKLSSLDLSTVSPISLIDNDVDGIVVTYQQSYRTEKFKEEWTENALVKFMKKSAEIQIYGVLDECHELTIKDTGKKNLIANKRASFFRDNKNLFYRLHLLTATPVKASCGSLEKGLLSNSYMPFVNYTEEGDVRADTIYQEIDAIKDKAIVEVNFCFYPVKHTRGTVDGEEIVLDSALLEWFFKNTTAQFMESKEEKNERQKEIDRIVKFFDKVYTSIEPWKQLIVYGDERLSKKKEIHSSAVGLIFAPTAEGAINIHRELLRDRSVLCVGLDKRSETKDCNFVSSAKIRGYLKSNRDKIDWIVSCEALNEGFDWPDCKVSILVPRLPFLTFSKFTQAAWRINRIIRDNPLVDGDCLTLDYKPIRLLAEISKKDNFGICSDNRIESNVLEFLSKKAKEKAVQEAIHNEQGYKKDIDIEIYDLFISPDGKWMTRKGEKIMAYEDEQYRLVSEIRIRSFWTRWRDIIFSDSDLQEKNYPPESPGIYIIANAKTTQVLYIGSSSNLLKRVSDIRRYKKLSWIKSENCHELFVTWIETLSDLKLNEDIAKLVLLPKYDREYKSVLSSFSDIDSERFKRKLLEIAKVFYRKTPDHIKSITEKSA